MIDESWGNPATTFGELLIVRRIALRERLSLECFLSTPAPIMAGVRVAILVVS
jgi:hypothetical protein